MTERGETTIKALRRQQNGGGKRPINPYLRIMWAAARGVGASFTASEIEMMSLNVDVANRAEKAVQKGKA